MVGTTFLNVLEISCNMGDIWCVYVCKKFSCRTISRSIYV